MKWIALILFAALLIGCGDSARDEEVVFPEGATVLSVEGMHCSGCKANIMRELAEVEGVDWAQIEYESGLVAYSGAAERAEVVAAIRNAGYEVVE